MNLDGSEGAVPLHQNGASRMVRLPMLAVIALIYVTDTIGRIA